MAVVWREMLVSIAWGVGGRSGRLNGRYWWFVLVCRNRFRTEGNESTRGLNASLQLT